MHLWSDSEVEAFKQRHDAGESWKAIARREGIPLKPGAFARAMQRRLRKRERAVGTQVADVVTAAHLVEKRREASERQEQVQELRRLTDKRAVIEELQALVRSTCATLPVPKALTVSTLGKRAETLILLLSDVHVGQHTPARINGGWTQTVETTQWQMRQLAEQVLALTGDWSELVILDLGDDVEGSNMRVSQTRIVDPLVAKQAALYGQMLAELVTTLLTRFDRVRIERIPGNHGRVSPKAGNAGLDELDPVNSWDWMAGVIAEAVLSPAITAGRVEVHNHEGFYGLTTVRQHAVIFEHGASLRGGGSFGGIPWYGVERMAASYRDLEGDYTLLAVGHWHRAWHGSAGRYGHVIANGAFPPTTPFVVSSKHQASRPCQVALALSDAGIGAVHRLYLDTPRERAPKVAPKNNWGAF